MEASGVVIQHPNRDKPASKATKAAVILLLLTSAGLIGVVTAGGWEKLQGAQMVAIGYVVIYAAMAYYVARWNRGVLPVAAALAIVFAVIAGVAAPGWFARDKEGLDDPALPPGILGLLTLIIVAVQLLLIAFAMRGFNQEWNVEVEVSRDEGDDAGARERAARRRAAEEARTEVAMPWEAGEGKADAEQETRRDQ